MLGILEKKEEKKRKTSTSDYHPGSAEEAQDRQWLNDYRPAALTSVVMKVFESLACPEVSQVHHQRPALPATVPPRWPCG